VGAVTADVFGRLAAAALGYASEVRPARTLRFSTDPGWPQAAWIRAAEPVWTAHSADPGASVPAKQPEAPRHSARHPAADLPLPALSNISLRQAPIPNRMARRETPPASRGASQKPVLTGATTRREASPAIARDATRRETTPAIRAAGTEPLMASSTSPSQRAAASRAARREQQAPLPPEAESPSSQ
jgi:hypothetical protein